MTDYGPTTALVVVDVQNDFTSPRGTLAVRGAEDIVAFVNAEIARARAADALVVYTADWHPEETAHFAAYGGRWPAHCVADTWGAEFFPTLDLGGPIVRKGVGGEDGYSGFAMRRPETGESASTGLADLLHDHGVTDLVIVGLATDYCVRETALDGIREGFGVTVIRDAVRAVDLEPGDGARALEAIAMAGGTVR